jgi:hypothetical protein
MDYVVDNYRAPDGSRYTGTLKGGLPNGLGTCVWQNGSQYDGEWRSGLMHGFGTYVWPTGQRYDGEWKVRRRWFDCSLGPHRRCARANQQPLAAIAERIMTQPSSPAAGRPPRRHRHQDVRGRLDV